MKKNFICPEEDYEKDFDCCSKDMPDCMDIRFYKCSICGQIVASIGELVNSVVCCEHKMTLLDANQSPASTDHHIPVYTQVGHKLTVYVGELEHPMTDSHHIDWICVITNLGIQWKPLNPHLDSATAGFRLSGGEHVIRIYSYCNLHGLWCGDSERN